VREQPLELLVVALPDLHEPQSEERLVRRKQTPRAGVVDLIEQLLDEALSSGIVVALGNAVELLALLDH